MRDVKDNEGIGPGELCAEVRDFDESPMKDTPYLTPINTEE